MICKICAQALNDHDPKTLERARKKLKDYTDEEYQQHLIDYHEYPRPEVPPQPPLTDQELTDALEEERAARQQMAQVIEAWQSTFTEIDRRLTALEKGSSPSIDGKVIIAP